MAINESVISETLQVPTIPDKEQHALLDDLSFLFIDSLGNKKIQSLDEFEKESCYHFDNKPRLDLNELKATSAFFRQNQTSSFFYQLPERVIWDQFQTEIRNQKDRNTSTAFAMVAAIEARYKRDYELDLDLSEQFFWHCYKSTSLSFPKVYQYENQSSFWGGGHAHGIRSAVNFVIPTQQYAPYLDQHAMNTLKASIPGAGDLIWERQAVQNKVTQDEVDVFEYSPLYISNEAREKAKYGVRSYILLDSNFVNSITNLEYLLSQGYEVIIGAVLKWRANIQTGVYDYASNVSGVGHVFLLVGYDNSEQVFYIKNSWGESGLIRVSYEFAEKCFSHGSVVTAVSDPNKPCEKSRALGRWNINHNGRKGELIIRRFTNEANEITRLGHYKSDDGKLSAVNGSYIHNGRGLSFSVTDDENADPTELSGQAFMVDIFSIDITQAAGSTRWQDIDYGVYMSREHFLSERETNFSPSKWKGRWALNNDGWIGTLIISHVCDGSIYGMYEAEGASTIRVLGDFEPAHPHVLRFYIKFSNGKDQPFVLHFHTGSADLASGYTFWDGKRFGMVAFKR